MAPAERSGERTASRTAQQLLLVVLVCFATPIVAAEQALAGGGGSGGGRRLQAAPRLPLDRIRLPPLFSIDLYVDASFPARFMELGQADVNATVVYVSSTTGTVRRGRASREAGQGTGRKAAPSWRKLTHGLPACRRVQCSDIRPVYPSSRRSRLW